MAETPDRPYTQPAEILASRKWDAALFTTYAFSISFFESVVFQALTKRKPCGEICVLVDVAGYASSLMERGASRVGRDYTLVPVRVPNVFHPKCTYLAGPDGDLLLVGSGNLTFGGYGKNLEVLEVLQPELHPQVFLDFAEFLEALAEKPNLTTPNVDCTSKFVKLARTAAGNPSETTEYSFAKLLHSGSRSIATQLAEQAASHGGAKIITLLSPYYDLNGSAVAELTRALDCKDIRISLPPNEADASGFQFSLANKLNLNLTAVRPKLQEPTNRWLHAKCIEVMTADGTLTLTGSVNATYPALCSTNNIEVGVLRHTDTPIFQWDKAEIPADNPQAQEVVGEVPEQIIAYARLMTDGRISGQVMAAAHMKGAGHLTLEKSGEALFDAEVAVSASGAFAVNCEDVSKVLTVGTVRVILKLHYEAAGWLEMDQLLQMSLEQRTIVGAIGRSLLGLATDDDDIALLNYLSVVSSRHLDNLLPEESATTGNEGGHIASKASFIPLSKIAPATEDASAPPPRSLHDSGADTIAQWFRNFRDQVLAPEYRVRQAKPAEKQRTSHPSEEQDGSDDQEQERKRDALADFSRRMQVELRSTQDVDRRRKLLCIWHEVTMYMLCERISEPEQVNLFLRRWLNSAQEFAQARAHPDRLERIFFTSVAALGFYALQAGSAGPLRELHELLERFCGGPVSMAYAEQALDNSRMSTMWRCLFGEIEISQGNALAAILEIPTSLQEIHLLYDTVCRGALPNLDLGILTGVSQYGQTILEELSPRIAAGDASRFLIPRVDNRFDSCYCGYRFSEVAKAHYMGSRIAKCTCGKLNLRFHP